MMRRTMVLFGLAAALTAAACSDDTKAPEADTQGDTVAAPDAVEVDTLEADSATVDSADAVASCEHPCLNAFGKNDKSLCPDPKSEWNCIAGCCEAVFRCQDDDDCAARGFTEGQCTDDRFACRCDVGTGVCAAWLCGDDAACGAGATCAAGACTPVPTAGLVPRLLDRPTVLVQGATTALHVDGVDPAKPDLAVAVTPTWASSAPTVVAVDQTGLLTGGAVAGEAEITATLPGGTATLAVRNVGVLTGAVNVIAVDEATLAPLTGRYAIIDTETGAVLVNEALPADGIIVVAGVPQDGVDVHLFADDHDWVSWLAVEAPRTLLLPVAATAYSKVEMNQAGQIVAESSTLDNVGVVQGTPDLSAYDRDGALEISLSSFALSSALFDFNLQVLLGADVKRYIDPAHSIPQVDASEPLTVPGGIIFNLVTPAVPSFVLSAPAGHHRLWSLGGRLELTEVSEYASAIIDSVAGGDLDFTRIVGAVFPLFRVFWSGYIGDVAIDQVADPTQIVTANPALRLPLGLSSALDIPPLPALGTLGWADALFLLGGALTPDGFMVPLGLNGGADTADKQVNPPDGIADGNDRTPEKDPFVLPMAPLFGGLQSPHTAYLMAIVAVAIPGRDDLRPDSGSAILVHGQPGAGPPAAPALGSFLGLPLTSSWTPATRALTVGTVAGADIQRLLFKGRTGRHWTVWLNGAASYVVPAVDALAPGQADRATDNVQLALVNSLDLEDGLTLDAVAAPGGVTLATLLGHVGRISFVDVKDPIPSGAR